jgi:hypothetical protein
MLMGTVIEDPEHVAALRRILARAKSGDLDL